MAERTPDAKASEPQPFVHTIRVTWADCDVARIAYTGRIPYFALEAIDAWWERHVGFDWYRLNLDRDVGTPFVHLSVDFRAPVTPRFPLHCQVVLTKLGESSVHFHVSGRQDGALCFEGDFVSVFIEASAFRKRTPPPDIKALIAPLVAGDEP